MINLWTAGQAHSGGRWAEKKRGTKKRQGQERRRTRGEDETVTAANGDGEE